MKAKLTPAQQMLANQARVGIRAPIAPNEIGLVVLELRDRIEALEHGGMGTAAPTPQDTSEPVDMSILAEMQDGMNQLLAQNGELQDRIAALEGKQSPDTDAILTVISDLEAKVAALKPKRTRKQPAADTPPAAPETLDLDTES